MGTTRLEIEFKSASSPSGRCTSVRFLVLPIAPLVEHMLLARARSMRWLFIAVGMVTALNFQATTVAAATEEKVRFSVAAITGSYMDEFVAIEKGYHREEGLTVEMIRAGGGIATQALIAGDLHFSTSAGS